MIFDKIFFKVLKIKWVLMKVVGTVGAVGAVGTIGAVGGVGGVGVLRETRRGSDVRTARAVCGDYGKCELQRWSYKKFCQRCSCEAIKTFGKV